MAFHFVCPKCGSVLQAEEEWEGRDTTCPHCGNPVRIERTAVPETAPHRVGSGRALNGSGRLLHRRGLDRLFFWWWFPLVFVLAGVLLGGVTFVLLWTVFGGAWSGVGIGIGMGLLVVIAVGCWLLSLIMWYILVYRYWQLIPASRALTSPGLAVGLLFIPLFNYVWQFIAIAGLGRALDRETGRKRAGAVAMIYCICDVLIALFMMLSSRSALYDVGIFWLVKLLMVILWLVTTILFQRSARRLLACYEGAGF